MGQGRAHDGAIIAPAWSHAPNKPARSALALAIRRTFQGKAANHSRKPGASASRSARLAEHLAAQLIIQLHARYPGRLAIRHTGQGCVDGWRDAAGGAVGAAVQYIHDIRISKKLLTENVLHKNKNRYSSAEL